MMLRFLLPLFVLALFPGWTTGTVSGEPTKAELHYTLPLDPATGDATLAKIKNISVTSWGFASVAPSGTLIKTFAKGDPTPGVRVSFSVHGDGVTTAVIG